MPSYSFVQYAGDGTTGPYVIPFPYLDRSHVSMAVDGVSAGFTFAAAAALTLDVAAPVGAVVEIRRTTPVADRLVDFTDGAVLTEVDLDTALLQQLYLAQETFDIAATAITLGPDGVYDATSRRLVSVADPTSAQDAATKAYVDATTPASAAAAEASATAAAASASGAASSAVSAATIASAASASATAAAGSATAAAASAASIAGGPVPDGGSSGQVLKKASGADQDIEWGAGGPQANYTATTDPDADNDITEGYGVGSIWVNTATPKAFTCVDASEGAAVWSGGGGSVSTPIGVIMAWSASAIPTGWLECDGAAISRTTYADLFTAIGTTFGVGDGGTTFNLPDLRGEFIRGLDNGRGIDVARGLGSAQAEAVGDHKHQLPFGGGYDGSPNVDIYVDSDGFYTFGSGDGFTSARRQAGDGSSSESTAYPLSDYPYAGTDGSGDNRPRNIALKYIIKHADASFTGPVLTGLPDASETEKGAVEIATQSEVDAGVDPAKVVVTTTLKSTPLPQIAPDVIIEDQKASGTGGGATNTGYYNTWKKRTLNTEIRDELGVTLASDEVTLPAGTYYAEAESPGFGSNHFRCRIYDETNAVELGLSDTGYSGTNAQDRARACAVFTLASPSGISVQYQSNYNGSSVVNLGAYGTFAGVAEVYTRLKIWRIA